MGEVDLRPLIMKWNDSFNFYFCFNVTWSQKLPDDLKTKIWSKVALFVNYRVF